MHSSRLTSLGCELDRSSEHFGWCRSSIDLLDDSVSLQERLNDDGYLYLPGYLDVNLISDARSFLLSQLSELGLLEGSYPVEAGIAAHPWSGKSCHHLVGENRSLLAALYSGRMIEFYEFLFQSTIRHFDFTWLRVVGPGNGTAPHSDSVYMGRGTRNLFTSWTPLMEITPDIGGLMLMPGSHRTPALEAYRKGDVDVVCTNRPDREPLDVHGWVGPLGDGKISDDPVRLQAALGLPWVTAECYRPGDVVVFNIDTVHGSLDNQSDLVRLSTDSRYQRADEPADERWIGDDPIGHGPDARKDMIC